ncbi:MAG: carboxypeptidase regulatory-like domain-containing protein, partial [Elusimicrobiota bacterium]
MKKTSGVTLVELMIGMAILTTAVVGLMGAFTGIQKSIQYAKSRTLATSLAQEKMQILKQLSYYHVLITTYTTYQTELSPMIPYDNGYFTPESVLEGSVAFTRLTYIQVAQEVSGDMQTLAPTTPDTGMKLATVSVIWTQGNEKRSVQLRSVISNPDTVMSNCVFSGRVKIVATATGISNALVSISENTGWRDTSDASGDYSVSVYPGSYNFYITAPGYFPLFSQSSIADGQTVPLDFFLSPMASGIASGTVWKNDHLVISQVVGSSVNAAGFFQEYIELFNPTTWTWIVATDASTPVIDVKYQLRNQALTTIAMNYATLTI